MPKKEWTPEERKAFGDKMRALKAKKLENKPTLNPGFGDEPKMTIQADPEIEALKRQIEELKNMMSSAQSAQVAQQRQLQQPQASAQGLVGTLEKYNTDRNFYPDPRERLADEARLKRFAFGENFLLGFEISTSSYRTVDNIQTKEPKFTVKLNRRLYDEDTGEPRVNSDGQPLAFTVSTLVFHEDPDTAIYIARENGVDMDQFGEKQFLDEMRYLRMRDWLIECFFPAPPPANKTVKEEVIGNKLVQVITINADADSDQPQINFHGLKKL